jgi:pimeloyl-ACP methyl ester carboxylesterase
MTATSGTRQEFGLGDYRLQAITGGSGRPLLILHDEMGYPGWMRWQEELARERALLIPLAPGFGIAPRLEWLRDVRDLACLYARWLRDQKLPRLDVIGFSLGGWVAAEMLANDPGLFRKLVLVAPLGIKPPEGAILDAYELTHRAHLEATVADPANTPEFGALYGGAPTPAQIEAFDDARAETARLAWQPYLHNPSLPHLIDGLGRKVPTLLVWGEDDRVVPRAAAGAWQRALGEAEIAVFERCGHRPEIERPDRFMSLVRDFVQ